MIEDIYRKIWEISPNVHNKESYSQLTSLTKELINLYDLQGRLTEDPFSPTRLRRLSLPVEKVNDLLVITKLLTVFDVFETEAEALGSFK